MIRLDTLARMVHIGLLYDHYGPLLTEHQREAIELYYLRNWSLHEIAESWHTSRQAVHDLINRAANTLETYENGLHLESRERERRETLRQILAKLEKAAGMAAQNAAGLIEAAAEDIRGLLAENEEETDGG